MLPGMERLNVDDFLLQVPFANADETRSSARYRWSCRGRGPRPFVILQWTLEGYGVFRPAGGSARRLGPGEAFVALVPEDAQYYFDPEARGPWRFAWLNFYGALALRLWRDLRARTGPVLALPPDSEAGLLLGRLARDTAARRFAADRYAASAGAFAFFTALCRHLAGAKGGGGGEGRRGVSAAVEFSAQHAGATVGVKTLAAEAGVSREHYSRVFKTRVGQTPAAFLRARRLQAADELLRTTTLPVAEVALRCGFTSARHLSDAYRARHGRSPQTVRA